MPKKTKPAENSDLTASIKGLSPGQSTLFPDANPTSVRALASRIGADLKAKFTTRTEKEGVRVLRWPSL